MHTPQGKKQRLEDTDDANLSLESWEAVEDVYEEMTDEERLQLNALDTGDEKGDAGEEADEASVYEPEDDSIDPGFVQGVDYDSAPKEEQLEEDLYT